MAEEGFGNLMEQARKMQEHLKQAQKEMSDLEVVGEAGGGLVKVVMNGRHDTIRVTLDASVQKEAVTVIEDLIAAANNDAVRKVEKASREKMSGLMSGFQMPGMGDDAKGSDEV